MFPGTLTHKGIRTESAAATFMLDAGLTKDDIGLPVAMVGNMTVGKGADGNEIVGFLESFEDRTVEGTVLGAVTWHMCADFEYSGTDPTAGQHAVCDGTGKVRISAASEAKNALITNVDTTNKIVSVIFR